MFSALCILLLVNHSTSTNYDAKNNRKRVCDLEDRTVNGSSMTTKSNNESPLPLLTYPDAFYFTPYMKNGKIEEAVSKSRVTEPFTSYQSFSGFLTINNQTNSNLFVWFFPCVDTDADAPLIVWLDSDHKCPSSCRVFDTTGPYRRAEGKIRKNRNTLLRNFHVLYIDSPIGAGFSFSQQWEGYSRNFYDAGKDVTEAVKQFAQIFPEYTQNEIYLNGGDTFTSKIAIYSAWHFHRDNNSLTIAGVMIGNGMLDPINMIGMSDLLYNFGIADTFTRDDLRSMEEEIKRLTRSYQQWRAYELYQNMVSKIQELGYEQVDDLTRKAAADDSDRKKISKIFSRVRIKVALHVGRVPYDDMQTPLCFLQNDFFTSASRLITKLIPHMKFFFYVGQYGVKVNAAKMYDFLRYLTWPGALAFHQLDLTNLCVADEVVGYHKTYSNLDYFVMRNSGNLNHLADPELMIRLWNRFTGFNEKNESLRSLVLC